MTFKTKFKAFRCFPLSFFLNQSALFRSRFLSEKRLFGAIQETKQEPPDRLNNFRPTIRFWINITTPQKQFYEYTKLTQQPFDFIFLCALMKKWFALHTDVLLVFSVTPF